MERQRVASFLLAALILTLIAWVVFSGRGLITINAKDAPIVAIIKSIQRQAGVTLVTNLANDTLVTMKVKRVPLAEALDVLAARTDSRWQMTWLLAPTTSDISTALTSVVTGKVEGWIEIESSRNTSILSDHSADPRKFEWKPEAMKESDLQSLLDQASQKTGILFAVPENWNPSIDKLPAAGRLSTSIPALAKSVKGTAASAIFLTRFNRPQRVPAQEATAQSRNDSSPRTRNFGGMRESRLFTATTSRTPLPSNPAWAEDRLEQQVRSLPKDEQVQIRQDLQEMRKFWEEVRKLPEDERRAKIREMMDRPEVQERMDQRMEDSLSRRSPQQRLKRYRRYIERKKQIKEGATSTR